MTMAVCMVQVAADQVLPAEAQLSYGGGPGSSSAGGRSDGGADGGPEAPPSPQSVGFSASLLQPEAQKGYWHDGLEDQWSDMTDYGGGVPEQWTSSVTSDGSWPSPPSVANVADWGVPMMSERELRPRAKRRFCTSYPDAGACRRGAACTFAHCREEIPNLLQVEEENQEPAALTDAFFMYKYKTRWCPKGVQHEWHTCVYAHNYQDARRPVSIGYGARLCPYWSKKDTGAEYAQRCPLGLRCPYSHGAKEQLYHPQYFKTIVCRDLRGNGGGKACPRHTLCAFYHSRNEKRTSPADDVDYTQPLPAEALPGDWIGEFLSPPFLPEARRPGGSEDCSGGGAEVDAYSQDMLQHCGMAGGMQMPWVVLMPVGCLAPAAADGGAWAQANGCTSPTSMSPIGSPMSNMHIMNQPNISESANGMLGVPGLVPFFMPMDGGASPTSVAMS